MPPDEAGRKLSRRDFVSVSVAGALGTVASRERALAAEATGRAKRPNVIVLFDDQLRADACSLYGGGNIATPNIERMAEEGVTFTNAISTCPLCTPFRGMLQTGRYPTHSGLVLNWVEANPRQRGIANGFRDAGYHTGFIGKWHLSAGRLKRAGKHAATEADRRRIAEAVPAYVKGHPETEFTPPGPSRLGYDHWEAYNFHSDFTRAFYYRDTPERLFMVGYETDAETDMAIEFIRKQRDSPDPFFLMIAPHPPHPPFDPKFAPPGYLDQVPEELHWHPNVPPDQALRKQPLPARCYYAMSKNVDDNLGRLLRFLDDAGLSPDTIVVLTADHGEMLGSRNRMNKMVPYREAVRIPLVVRWPGHVPAGIRSDALYAPIDHMPTLCRLAGLDVPRTADGTDLSREVLGRRASHRDAVLMMNYVSHWDYFDSGTNWPEWRGIKTKQHTYVKWLAGPEELYDDSADPYQMENLAEGNRDLPTLRKMRARLKDLLAKAHDQFLPGTAYADWYDDERNLVRTALGPV